MTSFTTRPDPFSEIQLVTLHAIRGANYWSRKPVTRMDLDVGAYEMIASSDVPAFTDQLTAALPGLEGHHCSIGTPGGFILRLRNGTYAAHIVEHVALELQRMIGHDVAYGRTRGTGHSGVYTLVFGHVHEGVGLRAAALALEVVQHAFAETLDPRLIAHAMADLRAMAMMPDVPPMHRSVRCGITGGAMRATLLAELVTLGVGDLTSDESIITDIAPVYLLHAGLPYSHSDVAVILDTTLTDVPERYRDPERTARLLSVVADAVPPKGFVICPDDAIEIHDLIRDAGRCVVKFSARDEPAERVRKAAALVCECLSDTRESHVAR